jgi:hypothetical protein
MMMTKMSEGVGINRTATNGINVMVAIMIPSHVMHMYAL